MAVIGISAPAAYKRTMRDLEAAHADAGALLDAHDYAAALLAYTDMLATLSGPDRARAHALRGFAYYHQERYSEAAADFTAAIQLQPDAVNTLFLRARCREELDDPSGALDDYNSITALRPDAADAWEGASLVHRYFGRKIDAAHAAAMAEAARRMPRN